MKNPTPPNTNTSTSTVRIIADINALIHRESRRIIAYDVVVAAGVCRP